MIDRETDRQIDRQTERTSHWRSNVPLCLPTQLDSTRFPPCILNSSWLVNVAHQCSGNGHGRKNTGPDDAHVGAPLCPYRHRGAGRATKRARLWTLLASFEERQRVDQPCPDDNVSLNIEGLDKKNMPKTDLVPAGRVEHGVVDTSGEVVSLPTHTAPSLCTGEPFTFETHHRRPDQACTGDNDAPRSGDVMVHTTIDALAGRSEQSAVEPGEEVPLRPTHTASNPYSPTFPIGRWSPSSTIGPGSLRRQCRVGDQASGQERRASTRRGYRGDASSAS